MSPGCAADRSARIAAAREFSAFLIWCGSVVSFNGGALFVARLCNSTYLSIRSLNSFSAKALVLGLCDADAAGVGADALCAAPAENDPAASRAAAINGIALMATPWIHNPCPQPAQFGRRSSAGIAWDMGTFGRIVK